jgi:hypothetical protein
LARTSHARKTAYSGDNAPSNGGEMPPMINADRSTKKNLIETVDNT